MVLNKTISSYMCLLALVILAARQQSLDEANFLRSSVTGLETQLAR